MKIKKFIDLVNREELHESERSSAEMDEKVVYFENSHVETIHNQSNSTELRVGTTQWSGQIIGEILVSLGELNEEDVITITEYQREKGLFFGEAAVELKLLNQDSILHALSVQFGYTYDRTEEFCSSEMIMASSPFGDQAEEFRTIRGQLLNNWLHYNQKTIAIVSPGAKEGRSYVAANLAMAFSQLGHSTLLIDANLRDPRQHEIFQFSRRSGLSMLLSGRVNIEDLDALPDQILSFQNLSVLGCGAIPPNPVELLSQDMFPRILQELERFFDVIIIDTPAGSFQADVMSICSAADSALMVARAGRSKMNDSHTLLSLLRSAEVNVVGSVLNNF